MTNKKASFFLVMIISIFLLSLINPIFIDISDAGSGNIDGNMVWWENQYARLEVYPAVEKNLCTHVQYANITWKYQDNIIDVACRYDSEQDVYNPRIWMWQNIPHIVTVEDYGNNVVSYTLVDISDFEMITTPSSVDLGDIPSDFYAHGNASLYIDENEKEPGEYFIGFDSYEWLNPEHTSCRFTYNYYGQTGWHQEEQYWYDWKDITHNFHQTNYNGKKYYYVTGFSVQQSKTYYFKYQYNTKANTNGKWDFLAKLNSETIQEALQTGHYVMIDPWWDSDWDYCKEIVIDHTKVGADLINFPFLFDNTSADFLHAQEDGDDFVFMDSTNTTQYNHEIEWFNVSGDNRLIAWVNVTSLSKDADTVLYLYYGKPSADNQEHVADTWDSDYVFVTHMNDATTSSIVDSTVYGNDGTKKAANQPIQNASGQIGYAQTFDGTDDYINCGHDDSISIGTSDFTVELWHWYEDTADTSKFITKRKDGDPYNGFWAMPGARVAHKISWEIRVSSVQYVVTTTSIDDGTWRYLACRYDRSDKAHAYVNTGIEASSDITSSGNSITTTNDLFLGSNRGPTEFGAGTFDEVRISTTLRSTDWLYATYNFTNDPESCITVGSETTESAPANNPPTQSAESPVNGSVNIGINPDFSITVEDLDVENMDITYYTNISEHYNVTNSSVGQGRYCWSTTRMPFERKICFANDLWWVFYFYNSDGGTRGDVVYRTSSDGASWSDATTLDFLTDVYSSGAGLDIYADGTTLHLAWFYCIDDKVEIYRRGTLNSDGSISWDADAQEIFTMTDSGGDPVVCVDSKGYPYIAYIYQNGTSDYHSYVLKSSTTDGTWVNDTGFPYEMTRDDYWIKIFPLDNERVYAVQWYGYNSGSGGAYGRLWDGNSWGEESIITETKVTPGTYGGADGVVIDNDIHFVFFNETEKKIYYCKYTDGTGWSGLTEIADSNDGVDDGSQPVLSKNDNDEVLCFYLDTNYDFRMTKCFGKLSIPVWSTPVMIYEEDETKFWARYTISSGDTEYNNTIPILYSKVHTVGSGIYYVHMLFLNHTGYEYLKFAENLSVGDGTYEQNGITDLFDSYHTTYWWSVNCTDDTDWSNETYHFTTIAENPPVISGEVPNNESTEIGIQSTCNITVNDADGDTMNVTFASNYSNGVDWVNYQTNSSVNNGSYSWVFTGASGYSTKYWWKVYCDDGTSNVSEIYYFTTVAEFIWIDITNTSWALGNMVMGTSSWTNETGKTFIADKDNCTVNTDLKLQVTADASEWSAASTGNDPDANIYRLNSSIDTWSTENQIITTSTTTISSDIPSNQNETFDLRFDAPISTTTGDEQSITITATLIKH